MEYERVLIFENRKIASYWFDKMIRFFMERNFFVKAYKATRMIIINNRVIYFKGRKEINEAFTRGRHKAMYFYNAEKQLEEKFLSTTKELING
jgi:hypothetical protein